MEGGVSANRAMKVVSILLALLILGLSGTLVGLIGRSLYYIDHNFLHTVPISFSGGNFPDAKNVTEFSNDMYHFSSIVKLDDTYALLVAGVFGTVLSLAILVQTLSEKRFSYGIALTGRRLHHIQLAGPRTIFAMDCCLALIAIIVTAISQAKSSQSARELDWSLFPQYHVPYDLSVWAYYRRRTPPVFTLEKYNCMLYDRYADNAGSPEHIPKDKIKSLCYEEMSARMLAIALLVIVLLRLGLKPLNDFVAWRRQNIEVRERKGGGFEDADVVSLTARSVAKSSEGRSSRTTVAMELPADRTSKVEMGNEGAVQEVPADGDVKKTGPHAIAYEMDGRANFATYELDGR